MYRWWLRILTVVLLVSGCSGSATPTPTPTVTAQTVLPDHTVRKGGNPPATAPAGQNQCLSFSDANFPDYPKETVVNPGEKFLKTWEITNNCVISTKGMHAVKIAGDVDGPADILLPDIPPGGKAEFSQEFTAPNAAPGVYTALYRIFTADGLWSSGMWVDVGLGGI